MPLLEPLLHPVSPSAMHISETTPCLVQLHPGGQKHLCLVPTDELDPAWIALKTQPVYQLRLFRHGWLTQTIVHIEPIIEL